MWLINRSYIATLLLDKGMIDSILSNFCAPLCYQNMVDAFKCT
jgi:hypothetical protein